MTIEINMNNKYIYINIVSNIYIEIIWKTIKNILIF